MSKQFVSIPIKDIRKTTSDCAVITLDIPADKKADFAYKQGQYLTFKALVNGEDLRRSYSLCSSPLDGEWQIAVKKIEDGRFSTFANEQLRKGDFLEVLPPDGKFF
ncbi:MAG: FAD-binding oxidoreductase, partial [Bacteroidota bacterium]